MPVGLYVVPSAQSLLSLDSHLQRTELSMTEASIDTGEGAPRFELESLSGRTYTERDLLGQPTHLLLLRHLG